MDYPLWFAFKFYLWQRSYNGSIASCCFFVLWFAFKFYLWQRSYNAFEPCCFVRSVVICFQILSLTTFLQFYAKVLHSLIVVICFQILSLTTFLQFIPYKLMTTVGCDLLSNFIFDNVLTIMGKNINFINMLWFAFKFYLWQRSYNQMLWINLWLCVVICFQILSLTTFLQYRNRKVCLGCVVICFQILSLTTFLQSVAMIQPCLMSCDLLSNFIFDNVLTIESPVNRYALVLWFAFKFYLWQRSYNVMLFNYTVHLLWFAFKFYLWQRSYNCCGEFSRNLIVVICFQILSLTTFLQFKYTIIRFTTSCDLLSNFIFDNVLTMPDYLHLIELPLWFAFKFYLWQRSYNSWLWRLH